MGANNSNGSEQENQKSAMVNYARGRKTLLYLCTPFVSRIALASYLHHAQEIKDQKDNQSKKFLELRKPNGQNRIAKFMTAHACLQKTSFRIYNSVFALIFFTYMYLPESQIYKKCLFIQTNSFIIFTCPNPVLLVPAGFGLVA